MVGSKVKDAVMALDRFARQGISDGAHRPSPGYVWSSESHTCVKRGKFSKRQNVFLGVRSVYKSLST